MTLGGTNLYAYCGNNPVMGYDPEGTWDWGSFIQGAGWLAVGITAICVGVSVLTCGVAAPVMMAVAAVTVTAGVLTTANGASEVVEAFTGYNVVRDGVFQGNEEAYNIYANTTAAVAEIGTAICGGWLKNTPKASEDPIKMALNQLDASGLRPGQTTLSRSKIMNLVDNFDPIKARSSIYSNSGARFVVEGHHTTVASTILGKGTCMNMGAVTSQLPSATNVYWAKKWYQFGRTVIKLVD